MNAINTKKQRNLTIQASPTYLTNSLVVLVYLIKNHLSQSLLPSGMISNYLQSLLHHQSNYLIQTFWRPHNDISINLSPRHLYILAPLACNILDYVIYPLTSNSRTTNKTQLTTKGMFINLSLLIN